MKDIEILMLKGEKGSTGNTGNGIQSVEKTGTTGNIDTYTITFTDGTTTTFNVANGEGATVIVDNLTDTSTTKALSANQGKVLKDFIDILTANVQTLDTGKVAISDIVDNLTSTEINKPLSAKQGKVLKEYIDSNDLIKKLDTRIQITNGSSSITVDEVELETGFYYIPGLDVNSESDTHFQNSIVRYTKNTSLFLVWGAGRDIAYPYTTSYGYTYTNSVWNLSKNTDVKADFQNFIKLDEPLYLVDGQVPDLESGFYFVPKIYINGTQVGWAVDSFIEIWNETIDNVQYFDVYLVYSSNGVYYSNGDNYITNLSGSFVDSNFTSRRNNIITAYTTSDMTAAGTVGGEVITLGNSLKEGSALTLSNNAVVIGEGVSLVKVSAQISIQANSSNSADRRIAIYKGSTVLTEIYRYIASGKKDVINISEALLEVSEGDSIDIRSSLFSGDIINGNGSTRGRTYLTVEVIK